jgi:hypothetical protein
VDANGARSYALAKLKAPYFESDAALGVAGARATLARLEASSVSG